jgi:hypothetical protein
MLASYHPIDLESLTASSSSRLAEHITPLLAGMDTVYFSCDLPLSDAMRERLTQGKTIARARAVQRRRSARSGWKRASLRRAQKAATLSSLRRKSSRSSY